MAVSRKAPDNKSKISSADGTPDFLENKITATEGVQINKQPPVSNETLQAKLDINGLTQDPSPAAGDFVATWDASASTHKKVALSDLPGGVGGTQPHTFINFLTGCTTFPDCPPVLCFCDGNLVQGCG
jgi:hypothetical protein